MGINQVSCLWEQRAINKFVDWTNEVIPYFSFHEWTFNPFQIFK